MRFSMGGRRGGARPGRPRVRSARSAAACSPMLLRAGLPCVLLPQLLVMSSLLAVSGRQGRGGVSVSAHSRLSRRSAATWREVDGASACGKPRACLLRARRCRRGRYGFSFRAPHFDVCSYFYAIDAILAILGWGGCVCGGWQGEPEPPPPPASRSLRRDSPAPPPASASTARAQTLPLKDPRCAPCSLSPSVLVYEEMVGAHNLGPAGSSGRSMCCWPHI